MADTQEERQKRDEQIREVSCVILERCHMSSASCSCFANLGDFFALLVIITTNYHHMMFSYDLWNTCQSHFCERKLCSFYYRFASQHPSNSTFYSPTPPNQSSINSFYLNI
jgi:hypothetical protein